MKKPLAQLARFVFLYRDAKTGIAWVEDENTGLSYSCHPNIHRSGSVRGMKSKGFWGKKDRVVRSHGFLYNIDQCVEGDEYDKIAHLNCQCGGKHCHKVWELLKAIFTKKEAK